MQIGVSLPATTASVSGSLLMDWAREADAGPFSSLGIIGRLAYHNYEPLITLAAAAAVTQRIRLMTTLLLAPLHNAGVLAKQAATLDALSGGRLTLGVGIGRRETDYLAAPASFHTRGKRLEEHLAAMRRIWCGQPLSDDVGPIGPPPVQAGGPEVLIGGYAPAAIRRVGRWGDGFLAGAAGDPDSIRQLYDLAVEAWQAEGRPGRPRFVGGVYYALGPDAAERAGAYIRAYYSFMGPKAENMLKGVRTSPDAVKSTIQALTDIGMDELVFWSCISDLDQLDRLAELVG